MKLLCPAVLDGYSRRKDRTVSLRFITQEKSSSEVMQIDSMTDQFGILYFRGQEDMNQLDSIDLDLYDEPKSQSKRLRNVLYIIWKQEGEIGDFKKYYKQKTEEVIQHFKDKIDE
jgi:hypothetical protein